MGRAIFLLRNAALSIARAAAAAVVTVACSAPASDPPLTRSAPLGDIIDDPAARDGGSVVVDGDVDVKTAVDVARLRGVVAIRGNLTVVRTELETLDGLESLREVKGLVVAGNAKLRSLQGLNGLEHATADVEIRENSALLDVDGLARLSAVDGTLQIGSDQVANWDPNARKILGFTPENANDKLAVVRLPALSHVRSLVLRRNPLLSTLDVPRLTEIDGDLEIAFHPKLTSIQSFADNVTRIGGELVLGRRKTSISYSEPSAEGSRSVLVAEVPPYENDTLAQVSFPKLSAVGAVKIAANPALERANLPELTLLGDGLQIDENRKLVFVDLGKLATMTGNLYLTSPALHMIRCGLTSVSGDVVVAGLSRLRDLAFLSHLAVLEGQITIAHNPALRDVSALRALRQLGGLDLDSNKGLTSLAGLENVTRVRGSVTIMSNEALASIDALGGITEIGEELVLWNNDKLTAVSLPRLTRVGQSFDINGAQALRTISLPMLASTGMFQVSLIGDLLTTFSFPRLTDVHGTMYLLGGPKNLSGLDAVERIDGGLQIMSETITAEAMQAFVDRVRARRGIGGPVQLAPL